MDENTNLVELLDENNIPITFEHVMTLDYDGREYVVLAPIDGGAEGDEDDDIEDEVIILRVEQDADGEDYYAGIEDDDELEAVFAAVTEVYDNGFE